MSLLERLKAVLGLGRPSNHSREDAVGMTVEHERDETVGSSTPAETDHADPDIGSPAAGSSTDDEETDTDGESQPLEAAESRSTPGESDTPERPTTDEAPVGADSDDASTDAPASEPDGATEPADRASDPVTAISGIGPAYSERLGTADIHTVSDLAAADADAIAEQVDISVKRLKSWVEAAQRRADAE